MDRDGWSDLIIFEDGNDFWSSANFIEAQSPINGHLHCAELV